MARSDLTPLQQAIARALFEKCYGTHDALTGAPIEYGAPGYRVLLDQFEGDAVTVTAAIEDAQPRDADYPIDLGGEA